MPSHQWHQADYPHTSVVQVFPATFEHGVALATEGPVLPRGTHKPSLSRRPVFGLAGCLFLPARKLGRAGAAVMAGEGQLLQPSGAFLETASGLLE